MDRTAETISKTQPDAPIAWVFFDIGSTLVDEEAAYAHRIRDMVRGTAVSFERFAEKRLEFAKAGYDGDKKAIEYFGLVKTPWHSEDEVPFEDCWRTLSALQSKGYRLGVIANQVPGAKARLDAWGLGEYFSVIASSAEIGLSKPDPGIFLRALEMAGCRPENAVMVGDRLDNDIRPAKQLGMRTVRIRKGIAAFNEPSCEAETPDHTVETLSEILKYL
jgi:putative hydrolase of the HAD superfamily